ncbi:MAG: hypothetical protein HYW48_08350 [Deltaproteobacteria bacterium]|nr:hypothetical protein [Deltaproteobacteria bacterium]
MTFTELRPRYRPEGQGWPEVQIIHPPFFSGGIFGSGVYYKEVEAGTMELSSRVVRRLESLGL